VSRYRPVNLADFRKEIENYSMIITFNGYCFDLPFIKTKFPGINLDKCHTDLRFAIRELGFSGGLKSIESQIGIARDDNIKDIDGFEAVRLWNKYRRGDKKALSLLIEYNKADIENLKVMMDFTFERLKEKTFMITGRNR